MLEKFETRGAEYNYHDPARSCNRENCKSIAICKLNSRYTFSVCFFSSLEPLFFQYGVDVIIEAHEHSYERLWPVFNDTVTAHDYINPKAPVHFISGAAGCNEFYGICVNPMLGPRGM